MISILPPFYSLSLSLFVFVFTFTIVVDLCPPPYVSKLQSSAVFSPSFTFTISFIFFLTFTFFLSTFARCHVYELPIHHDQCPPSLFSASPSFWRASQHDQEFKKRIELFSLPHLWPVYHYRVVLFRAFFSSLPLKECFRGIFILFKEIMPSSAHWTGLLL